ncbi:NifB/NifX family molybdenum-iron cluster-binding protein, partial [Marinobacterium litorale]|jgi:predicted Fe-Mo cluster-binding NifX family protein|uniref:NifB/NifX family molybdenum-iron cluster-binding protein n=1 Tax=Marinobacterium litorale TaxID=404770 RepID=UPI00056D7752
MKIAVTSQNRKTVTDHPGRCRKFWIYTIEDGQVASKRLLELSKAESFHDSDSHEPHPLDDIDVLITASTGRGLTRRLSRKEIQLQVSNESDPDTAVRQFLESGST